MTIRRIRHKLLMAVALALSLGFVAIAYFYNQAVEKSILTEYQRTLHRLTDSVVMSIETIMTENHAEIMPEYARRLKALPGLLDFRIARKDGTEAYIDNKTIDAVNARAGEILFQPRVRTGKAMQVFNPDDPLVARVLRGEEAVAHNDTDAQKGNIVHFFDAIPNTGKCGRCHDDTDAVRGVIKVTTSMADVERDMMKARWQSMVILVVSLLLTMGATGYMLGRSVAEPIEIVTRAMAKISAGDFGSKVIVERKDELGNMATSFNKMTGDLQDSYLHMLREQEKLSTVIQGAREAVVVTDAAGKVVLVNAAACQLLGKTEADISRDGIINLIGRPELFGAMLDANEGGTEPQLVDYGDLWLMVSASTIHDDQGRKIGSAALLRDVTQEQRLLNELQRLSTTDALTDVFNRRHLDATLKAEMQRAKQVGLPLSVIMFDADHFKKFNDTYGHDQGDRVLKMLGKVMKEAVRKYDVPCRYGGEEFNVVLPSTDSAGAFAIGERLRLAVEAMRVDGLQVTISLGIASYPEVDAATPEALILAADAALYQSKEKGRNCTTIATAEMVAAGG